MTLSDDYNFLGQHKDENNYFEFSKLPFVVSSAALASTSPRDFDQDIRQQQQPEEDDPLLQSEDNQISPISQVVLTILYFTVIVVSVGGNALVIYSIFACRRMHTVTNYFILNLSCADMLTAIVCIPSTFIANMLIHHWPFGVLLCPVVTYFQVVAVFLSAFTLVGISIDRFRAVVFPLRPRLTTKAVVIILTHVWILSLIVPLPVAILSKIVNSTDPVTGDVLDQCQEEWPDSYHRYVYTTILMILQYFCPLSVLAFTYAIIGYIIWVKKIPGEAENKRDQRLASSKRKMVKMMIAVVVVYALCWLPLHCITLIGDTHPVIWNYRHIQTIWIACHWLAMSNCCYNPIVYCWMNDNFRSRFRYALRCLPCFADQSNRSAFAVEHSTNQRSVVGIKSGIFPSMVGTQRRLVTDSNSTASPMSIRSGRVNNCSKHNLSPGGVNSRLIDHIQLSDVMSSNKRCHSTAAAVNL